MFVRVFCEDSSSSAGEPVIFWVYEGEDGRLKPFDEETSAFIEKKFRSGKDLIKHDRGSKMINFQIGHQSLLDGTDRRKVARILNDIPVSTVRKESEKLMDENDKEILWMCNPNDEITHGTGHYFFPLPPLLNRWYEAQYQEASRTEEFIAQHTIESTTFNWYSVDGQYWLSTDFQMMKPYGLIEQYKMKHLIQHYLLNSRKTPF